MFATATEHVPFRQHSPQLADRILVRNHIRLQLRRTRSTRGILYILSIRYRVATLPPPLHPMYYPNLPRKSMAQHGQNLRHRWRTYIACNSAVHISSMLKTCISIDNITSLSCVKFHIDNFNSSWDKHTNVYKRVGIEHELVINCAWYRSRMREVCVRNFRSIAATELKI